VVDLTADEVLELKERFGSLHDAGVAALRESPFVDRSRRRELGSSRGSVMAR